MYGPAMNEPNDLEQPVPLGPMGVPIGAAMMPAPEPGISELLCLHGDGKGPCAHLWEYQTNFEYGNPGGTFEPGEEPRQWHRYCQRGSDDHELAGAAVYVCNRYELIQITKKEG